MTIPKIIHQYWDRPTPPQSISIAIETWKTKNHNFTHILWNDQTASEFLRKHLGGDVEAVFKTCTVPAMRADVFRLAVLLVLGGVYVDADEDCVQSLESILTGDARTIFYHILRKGRDGSKVRILRNAFICAMPGHWFIRRILITVLQNIATQNSRNVWAVSGPGVVTKVYRMTRPSDLDVKVISKEEAFRYTRPNFKHTYRTVEGHWSENMLSMDIFGGSAPGRVQFKSVPYVFLGHPRCGSASLAAGLRSIGFDVGHERLGKDGIVSWWYTGFFHKSGDLKYFKTMDAGVPTLVFPDSVMHYLRNPASAISSIIVDNEFNSRDNNSFRFRRQVIRRHFGRDIQEMGPVEAAANSYVYWNELSEMASDMRTPILIERPDLTFIRSDVELAALPVHNTTTRKFRLKKIDLSLDDIKEKVSAEIFGKIDCFSKFYGNTASSAVHEES